MAAELKPRGSSRRALEREQAPGSRSDGRITGTDEKTTPPGSWGGNPPADPQKFDGLRARAPLFAFSSNFESELLRSDKTCLIESIEPRDSRLTPKKHAGQECNVKSSPGISDFGYIGCLFADLYDDI
ncbi:MAG: hypothetical protein Q9195_002900 [Heterodermia aff. obscurata]